MQKPTHPERFAKRAWSTPVHRTTDLARRQGNIVEVYESWSSGAGSFYDFSALSRGTVGPDDVPIGALGLENDIYVHFGQEQANWLSRVRDVFVDGIYLTKREYKSRAGYFLTLVTDRVNPSADRVQDDACIACGWIDAELSIDDGMALLGLWGDEVILQSTRRFEIEFFVGAAISAVASSFSNRPEAAIPGRH